MSYTRKNYPTKKALRDDVLLLQQHGVDKMPSTARDLTLQHTSIANDEPTKGVAFLEGPHYPAPHKWYAKVLVSDGIVVKVLS